MATEKRLIDANALIESGYDVTLDKVFPDWAELPDSTKEAVCKHGQYLKKMINELPSVEAVEVVRCKDCVFCHYNSSNETYKCSTMNGMYRTVEPNEFCSYGERKDNDL